MQPLKNSLRALHLIYYELSYDINDIGIFDFTAR